MIDTTFNVESDSMGRDPDSSSPMLKRYHKLLWSKPLPNGEIFDLHEDVSFFIDGNSDSQVEYEKL